MLVFDLSLKTKSVRIEQEGKKAVMKQEQRASRVTGVCKRDEQDMFWEESDPSIAEQVTHVGNSERDSRMAGQGQIAEGPACSQELLFYPIG